MQTSRTAASSSTHTPTQSQARPREGRSGAVAAPWLAKASSACGRRAQSVVAWPAKSKRSAMGVPWLPRPTNPMRMVSSSAWSWWPNESTCPSSSRPDSDATVDGKDLAVHIPSVVAEQEQTYARDVFGIGHVPSGAAQTHTPLGHLIAVHQRLHARGVGRSRRNCIDADVERTERAGEVDGESIHAELGQRVDATGHP